jgi:hypothetical protein
MINWDLETDKWWYDDLLDALEEIGFDSFAAELREFAEDEDWIMDVGHEISGEWLSEWIDEYREDYHNEDDPRCIKLLAVLEWFWETQWSDQDD